MEKKVVQTKAAVSLIEERIKEDARVVITVKGESMRPFYRDGITEVMLVSPKIPFRKGDAVLYTVRNDIYFLHRVHKVRKDDLIIRGDALKKREVIPKEKIIATVEAHKREDDWVQERSFRFRWKVSLWRKLLPCRRYLLALSRKISKTKENDACKKT